jgi:hypothetical protein
MISSGINPTILLAERSWLGQREGYEAGRLPRVAGDHPQCAHKASDGLEEERYGL